MINDEIKQDVWSILDKDSILCVLTNDTVNQWYDNLHMKNIVCNPMGAGIAGECKERNPEFPELVGIAILTGYRYCGIDKQTGAQLFRFSTKSNISDKKSDINLIETSLNALEAVAIAHKDKKIYLPRPGCGIGGLDWEIEVKPLVEKYLGKYSNVYIVSK